MTNRSIVALFLLFGVLSNPAEAGLISGCLGIGGQVTKVATGDQPARPCRASETLIQWESADPLVMDDAGAAGNSDGGADFVDDSTGPIAVVSQTVMAPYDATSLHLVSANVLILGLDPTERLSCVLTRSDGMPTYPNGDEPRIQLFHGGEGISEINQSLIGMWQGTTAAVTYSLVCDCANCDSSSNEFVQLQRKFLNVIVVPNNFAP